MRLEPVYYQVDGMNFKGYWAFPTFEGEVPGKLPVVIVAHAWMGQDHFAREKAQELAQLGYIGFAADVYGDGVTASNDEEAQKLMIPLFENRALLQKRIRGAFDTVCHHPDVDPKKVGVIGFCFGGLTAIELLRSGADVKGAVSFHGVLGTRMESIEAKTVPIAKSIKGSLLILHGHEDPLVSSQDIDNMQRELSEEGVDWQMNIYSHTSHAFTNPEARDKQHGLMFHPRNSKRAWDAMRYFLSECFGQKK